MHLLKMEIMIGHVFLYKVVKDEKYNMEFCDQKAKMQNPQT